MFHHVTLFHFALEAHSVIEKGKNSSNCRDGTGDKTGMVVSVLVGGSHTCILRGLHTYFPPHEPYIVANDCEYYTVPYLEEYQVDVSIRR